MTQKEKELTVMLEMLKISVTFFGIGEAQFDEKNTSALINGIEAIIEHVKTA